jgi:two-component system chemotaxis sensor kinase CheA
MGGIRTPEQDGDACDLALLRGAFLDEACDNVSRMETLLLATGGAAPDDEASQAIFRLAHSLKGGASAFGMDELAELMHALESLLDGLRRNGIAMGDDVLDGLFAAVDAANRLLARQRAGDGAPVEPSALPARLRELARSAGGGARGAGGPARRRLQVTVGPLHDPAAADGIADLFAEIAGLGRCESADAGVADATGTRRFLVETDASDAELLDLFAFHVPKDTVRLDEAAAPRAAAAPAVPAIAPESATIRVPVAKIDRLIGLADGLLGTHAQLAATGLAAHAGTRPHRELVEGFAELARDARLLRDAASALRAVSAASLFARFQRLVRDLGVRLGKPLALRTEGGDLELDAALAERLVDPLTQLVRNAADHGIESPAAREALGKPVTGTVTLAAVRRGDETIVEVSDDGRGLDRTVLLHTAAARGHACASDGDEATLWRLILEPGFTTAAEVTEVSGRGVGMDVVRRGIEALGGSVDIESRAGQGLRVSLHLPSNAATGRGDPPPPTVASGARGPDGARDTDEAPRGDRASAAPREYLVVELAGQPYGIDVGVVLELRGPEVPTPIAGAPPFVRGAVTVGGRATPVLALRLVLGLPPAPDDASTAVVVLAWRMRAVGVVVDAVADVVALEPGRVRPAPPVDVARDAGFVTGLATLDGRTLILVDVERLLGVPELALDSLAA